LTKHPGSGRDGREAVDYLGRVDRDAHVRAARRRQALDALAFERNREAMLVGQLEDVLAEVDGARLDADLFAQMSPDDVRLVQVALGEDMAAEAGEEAEPEDDAFGFSLDVEDDETETGEARPNDVEAEIARLQDVLESSRRVQEALERYLALLAGQPVRVTGRSNS
jgi:hypothetical protein